MKVKSFKAREILDSRGRPTIEVEIKTDCGIFSAIAPSGASCGKYEACELRDGDKSKFDGLGVLNAVNNVNTDINNAALAMGDEIHCQKKFDDMLIKLDGTNNKTRLGANAMIASSMAVCKMNAFRKELPLWKHINNLLCHPLLSKNSVIPKLPLPLVNIINGGMHADNNIAIQEFMIVPVSENTSFKDHIRSCCEVFSQLKKLLKNDGYSVSVGDEGGFAPNLQSTTEALEYLERAITASGYKLGVDFKLALDVAASAFYNKEHGYEIDSARKTSNDMIEFFDELISKHDILSIEDALDEEDYEGWTKLTSAIGSRINLVGDDLFVTNPELLKKGIESGMANTILIKPNQIGTVSETLQTIAIANDNNYKYIISHRSGETEDTFISHLAVGSGSGFIKTGSVCRGERTCKYNELIRIEEEI